MLKLVSGTTFAQILAVLVSPIVARLYSPAAFGISSLFGSVTTIIGVIVCMRYELSIMLPKEDTEAANLLAVSVAFVCLVSGVTALVVWFWSDEIAKLLKAPPLASLLWIAPLAVFASGLSSALNYWNSRTRRFGRLSIARVASSLTSAGTQVGAGVTGHATPGSLIGASVLGTTMTTVVLGGQILHDDGRLFRRSIRWQRMLEGLRRHQKFPRYGTASALLNSISWQLPSLLLQAFFSSTVVGFYALGNRLLRLPMDLIGGAISQVFYQRAATAHRSGDLASVVESAYRRLVAFSLFPMVLLTFAGRDVTVVFFGARWAEAGVYTQILAIWTFFWFISSPLTTIFSVLEKQEFSLKLNIGILISRFASLAVGGWLGNARLAISLFAGTGVLAYGYLNFAVLTASGVPRRRAWKVLMLYLRFALPAAAILGAIKILGASPLVVTVVAGLLFAAYALYEAKADPQIASFIGDLRRRKAPPAVEAAP